MSLARPFWRCHDMLSRAGSPGMALRIKSSQGRRGGFGNEGATHPFSVGSRIIFGLPACCRPCCRPHHTARNVIMHGGRCTLRWWPAERGDVLGARRSVPLTARWRWCDGGGQRANRVPQGHGGLGTVYLFVLCHIYAFAIFTCMHVQINQIKCNPSLKYHAVFSIIPV